MSSHCSKSHFLPVISDIPWSGCDYILYQRWEFWWLPSSGNYYKAVMSICEGFPPDLHFKKRPKNIISKSYPSSILFGCSSLVGFVVKAIVKLPSKHLYFHQQWMWLLLAPHPAQCVDLSVLCSLAILKNSGVISCFNLHFSGNM